MTFIKCPKCQAEIEGDSYFCDQCGAELFVCPKCGAYGKGKRCTRCGEPLVSAQSLGSGPAPASNAPAAQPVSSTAQATPDVQPRSGIQSTPGVQPIPTTQPAPAPFEPQSSSAPSGASITTDIDKVIGSINSPMNTGAPAGATIRPRSIPPPAAAPAAQRQVPGHLVCRNPHLRLYIDDVIIGRREGGYASVFASFGMVSGRHAQISHTPSGGWQVMDLGSTNGTCLNGRQLMPNSPVAFWVGDTISFANIDFEAVP